MAWHKLLIEMGMGVDQHGQSPTHACQKAILDAVHRVCMPSLVEGGLLSSCKVKLTIDLGLLLNRSNGKLSYAAVYRPVWSFQRE